MLGHPSPKRTIQSLDWLLLFAVLGVAGVSCRHRAERTIQDTEGRSFRAQCSVDRICTLSQVAGPEGHPTSPAQPAKPAGSTLVKLRNTGRLVGVCGPIAMGSDANVSDCRPIVCKSANDCPPAEGLDEGVCINGFCTEPSHPLIGDDAVMLCLAGTGIGPRTAQQVERLALGLNCGNPCRVPKPCRQP